MVSSNGKYAAKTIVSTDDPLLKTIQLAPTGSASGRLRDASTGQALVGYSVDAHRGVSFWQDVSAEPKPVTTDGDGRFLVESLIPGLSTRSPSDTQLRKILGATPWSYSPTPFRMLSSTPAKSATSATFPSSLSPLQKRRHNRGIDRATIIGHVAWITRTTHRAWQLLHRALVRTLMDHQEKHRQHKEKEREQKNKADQAYEVRQEKRRLPVNSVWLIVVGIVLTMMALYVWTFGFATPW